MEVAITFGIFEARPQQVLEPCHACVYVYSHTLLRTPVLPPHTTLRQRQLVITPLLPSPFPPHL